MIASVYTLVFSTQCAQFNIIAAVVINTVFRLPQSWTVVGKDNQPGLASSDHLQCLSVPQHELYISFNKLESGAD